MDSTVDSYSTDFRKKDSLSLNPPKERTALFILAKLKRPPYVTEDGGGLLSGAYHLETCLSSKREVAEPLDSLRREAL